MRETLPDSAADLADPPVPRRDFEVDGEAWAAEELGSALTGVAGDPGARVLLVTFRRPDAEEPEREALVPGSALDGMSELELEEAFRVAGSFRGKGGDDGLFEATRRRRSPRRG